MATNKLGNLSPEIALRAFAVALGNEFAGICAVAKTKLGNWEKDIKSEVGDWKCSAKCVLVSKEGHKVQMPPNDAIAILLKFGMRLNEIAEAGQFDVDAEIPKDCSAYVDEFRKRQADKSKATAEVVAK